MATSNLIQFLAPGEASDTSNRSEKETFLAAGTIAVGDLVSLDVNQTLDSDKLLFVIASDSASAVKAICIGVATAAAVLNENCTVLLRGISTVKVDGSGTAVAAGDALCLSGAKLVKAVAGEGIVAQALVAVTTDTTAKVYVLPRF
jgi:2-methylcitrate dehydratase PrpD